MHLLLSRTARTAVQFFTALAVVGCGGSGAAGDQPVVGTALEETSAHALAVAADAATPGLSLSVLSATGGSALPFTAGQALRQGQVPKDSALVADIADFQFVVKNRWPDGSAKFAVLSGRADMSANSWRTIGLSVASAPPPGTPVSTADLAATGITASIQFGSFGTAVWNAGDWASPAQTWVAGPQMSAFVYRKPIGSDAHLVAWLEVRAYKGGRVEVMPWIENGYLKVAGPTSKSGSATFTLGGTQRFNQSLTLLNHQRAVLANGTTLTHWFGGDPQVTPRPDAAYLMSTKLVPNYRGHTSASSSLFSRLPTSYTPLMQGSFSDAMGGTGYQPAIGLLPEWDVAYLTSGGDPRALRAVLINGYAAGRYGIHYRDETTNRPLRFSSYATLVMSGGSGVDGIGASTAGSYTPTPSGSSPPAYNSPHHPSMGYMAYLLTGWNYFLEETQLLATANFLKNGDGIRLGSQGVMETTTGSNTTRGAAWAIRTLAQAATITPDADSLRAEFVNSLGSNIDYYHGRYIAKPNNPLGLVQPYEHYTSSDPWQAAMWMDDFFTGTFGYLKDLQAYDSAVKSQLDAFLTWKYRSVVGRLGGSGSNDFAYPYAAQYNMNYAPGNSADWAGGTGPWYANWAAVARSMSLPTTGDTGTDLSSGYPTEATSYWGNLMPAISYAVDHGAAGAAEAWARITSAPNFATQAVGYDDNPVWGVQPRSDAPPPTEDWIKIANQGQIFKFTTATTVRYGAGSEWIVKTVTGRGACTNRYFGGDPAPKVTKTCEVAAADPAPPPPPPPPPPSSISNLEPGHWMELPNTTIRSVLPSPPQLGYAPNIVYAWNGGTVDTARNRLLVWGGGHADYYGNEVYALDLNTLTIQRVVDPSPQTPNSSCASALPDGTPTSRHTYGGLAYIAHADRMFAVNGALAPCGNGDSATWTRDFTTNKWQQMIAVSPTQTAYGTISAYDAATKQVFVKDQYSFFAYSLESNKYTKLNASDQYVDYHLSAAIDSKRRKFVMIGDGVQVIDLATNAMTTMTTTSTPAFVTSKQSPGIAYDPVADRIVAWHGGGNVYALNMDTGAWTQVATGPGPTASAPIQGTFGRWGYVPQLRVFAMVNGIDQNAWVFRLAK